MTGAGASTGSTNMTPVDAPGIAWLTRPHPAPVHRNGRDGSVGAPDRGLERLLSRGRAQHLSAAEARFPEARLGHTHVGGAPLLLLPARVRLTGAGPHRSARAARRLPTTSATAASRLAPIELMSSVLDPIVSPARAG